jgi:hypothetical protein
MAKVGVTGMGLRAGALPGGRAASAGGLPGQRRSGRGAATIRAAFVPDKENMDLTNSQPDHPVLKDPCYIKDRMTGEEVICDPLVLLSPPLPPPPPPPLAPPGSIQSCPGE